jgi:hypothetical protein
MGHTTKNFRCGEFALVGKTLVRVAAIGDQYEIQTVGSEGELENAGAVTATQLSEVPPESGYEDLIYRSIRWLQTHPAPARAPV